MEKGKAKLDPGATEDGGGDRVLLGFKGGRDSASKGRARTKVGASDPAQCSLRCLSSSISAPVHDRSRT